MTSQVTSGEALRLLAQGDLDVMGRLPWSSNQTFLARLTGTEVDAVVVYKPRRGERPLWDFPEGSLCEREVATFWVSEALGWAISPPTLLRDGPYGPGMVQLFVDHDPDEHYLTLAEDHGDRFRYFAAFDVVVNNADRKSGHCLRARDGHIWGIDHGLTFHPTPKLRTVIWDYAGEPLGSPLIANLEQLDADLGSDLGARLEDVLSPREMAATRQRLARLLDAGRFPEPRSDYPFPWPVV